MSFAKDPLLAAANVVLVLCIFFIGLAAALLLLGGPAALIFPERVVSTFADGGVADPERLFPLTGFVLFAIGLLLVAAVYFLVLLRRIVRSVGEGDPFNPDNALRLSRMGWLALIGQLATIPIGVAVVWIARIVEDSDGVAVENDFGMDLGGILLVLVLFILARVFRHGTALREDLEGTV